MAANKLPLLRIIMITAFFFQNNKIEFDGEERREKKITKRVEERCVSVHGLYFVVDNVLFGVTNQINMNNLKMENDLVC